MFLIIPPKKHSKKTDEYIKLGVTTLYEPAFIFNDFLFRIDIIHREFLTDPWQFIEVKSSTHVRDDLLLVFSIQYYVLKNSG